MLMYKANSTARPQTDVRFVRILSVWVGQWGRVRACPGMRWPCAQCVAASVCPILSASILKKEQRLKCQALVHQASGPSSSRRQQSQRPTRPSPAT